MGPEFQKTNRTSMRRRPDRATYDQAKIYAVFDEALFASVAICFDGRPQVQPMIHLRLGRHLIFHGLAGNRVLSALASGEQACINVAVVDALALARRIEGHSMHYRSATAYGRGQRLIDEREKTQLMERVFAKLVGADRYARLPRLPKSYLSNTLVVRVVIENAIGKINEAVDTESGPDGIWSGVIPVRGIRGSPEPDARTLCEGIEPPQVSSARLQHPERQSFD